MKITIVFASEILKKHKNKIDEYFFYGYPNSYLYYHRDTQKIIIYIDDIGTKEKRQRFSLAHELMHIILGHEEQSERNEAEANFGATYLLAPTSLVLTRQNDESLLIPKKVEYIYDISVPEAKIVARYNTGRLSCHDLGERDYEKTINRLLRESLDERISNYH